MNKLKMKIAVIIVGSAFATALGLATIVDGSALKIDGTAEKVCEIADEHVGKEYHFEWRKECYKKLLESAHSHSPWRFPSEHPTLFWFILSGIAVAAAGASIGMDNLRDKNLAKAVAREVDEEQS